MFRSSERKIADVILNYPDIDLVEKLLDEGSGIDDTFEGYTPLAVAINKREIEIIKLLLDRGADINKKSVVSYGAFSPNDTLYPILIASKYSTDINILSLLIKRGAIIDIKNQHGATALMLAVNNKNVDAIKLLLDAGADIDIKNNEGNSALSYSFDDRYHKNLDIMKYLLERGASPFVEDKCHSDECSQLLAKYQWKQILQNIERTAKQYSRSGDLQLPKNIWNLVLLRKRQQALCQNLSSSKYKFVLRSFAVYLDIPMSEETTKSELCGLISRQLTWGAKYTDASAKYFEIRENRDKVLQIAANLGVDVSQPIRKVLDDLADKIHI